MPAARSAREDEKKRLVKIPKNRKAVANNGKLYVSDGIFEGDAAAETLSTILATGITEIAEMLYLATETSKSAQVGVGNITDPLLIPIMQLI